MDIADWEFAYEPTTGVRQAHETPLVLATEASLEGYGCLVDDPKTFPIEIVRWPARGWRAIDLNSGDQGGVTEGLFEFCWKGNDIPRASLGGTISRLGVSAGDWLRFARWSS